MPVTYDIKTDFLYKEGLAEGLVRKEYIFVERGWKKGLAPEEIAELADMPVERVKTIIRELEEEANHKG